MVSIAAAPSPPTSSRDSISKNSPQKPEEPSSFVPERPSHKLVVILHADVVGSTVLVQHDETVAHQRIQDSFRRFSETIEAYGGITHELRGDALVAEFDRASDAVCAGIAFQADNSQVNATLDDDVRPEVRIGISMGEVVVADNTITGAGVVLAQRLEQLADPGGMCIQDAAYQSVPKRLPFEYESLGEQQVKGFEEPVRAYSVALKSGMSIPSPDLRDDTREIKRVWRRVAGAVVVLLIVVGSALAWWQPWKPKFKPTPMVRLAQPMPGKSSIAVLPFTNMSDDPKQEYFVDGMSEDLITDLSKISGLFVIARNSSFTYKGKEVDVKQVSRELGVKYILEGSVRRAGDQVRINAQLIDATTGGHLWAERYDGGMRNVFSLQDEITAKIVTALAVQLTVDEEAEQTQRQTNDPQAYEAFLKGWEHYRRDTTDHYAKAMEYFQQAVSLDPEYSRAYAAMASIYWKSYLDEFYQVFHIGRTVSRERGQQLLKKALLKPTSLAYQAASEISLWQRDHNAAISDGENAIALDPNSAGARVVLANALIFSGQPEMAMKLMDNAEKLDPFSKARYEYVRGLAFFGMEQYDKAAASLERARELNPEDWATNEPGKTWCYPCEILAATYGHLGRTEDAAPVIAYLDAFGYHRSTIGGITPNWPYKETEDTERFSEGLRKAGLPD